MTHGLIIGKFMPPHRGHKLLVDFGAAYADDLTVVVCSTDNEPILGARRYQWMRESFPHADVRHLHKNLPQEPNDDPEFWSIWRSSLRGIVRKPIDYVFASETYGKELAEKLGAEFIPVDIGREQVPISGTAIRDAPLAHWESILPAAQPYFLKRVCVFGPESTGKTTLTKKLAAHYHTTAAMEWARLYLDKRTDFTLDDIVRISRGQAASEEALAKQANRVLFNDTDGLITAMYSDLAFGTVPPEVLKRAEERTYDLYLLLDTDVPWVADPLRTLPDRRKEVFEYCKRTLEEHHRPYVVINGTWDERLQKATHAVDTLLSESAYAAEAAA